ncbi:MAG: MBL fold metallo-hydrolase [Treponema sp.]|nr:MBL fold metallo-hydrolase [Treponema sp.]
MAIHIIRTGLLRVNTLVVPLGNGRCFVVDPAACVLSGDAQAVTDFLKAHKLDCTAIILTHSHFDHITGIAGVKAAFPAAKIAIHKAEINELTNPPGPMNDSVLHFFGELSLLDVVAKQPAADTALTDGMEIEGWRVIHTPGHTPGSICLYNAAEKTLISGDTVFAYGGYGRTDMYGGDESQLIHSLAMLREKIPAGVHVYPGHDQDFIWGD